MNCLLKNNINEIYYKQIINNLTKEIDYIKKELEQYKNFHDAILENNIIEKKFQDYKKIITDLEKENNELKSKINILDNTNN